MGNCTGVPKDEQDPEFQSMQNMQMDIYQLKKYSVSDSNVDTQTSPTKGRSFSLKYDQMLSRELKSNIYLQVQFHTNVPSKMEYSIDYKTGYSVLQNQWKEENIKASNHRSNPSSFEYSYQADKQEIVVEITAQVNQVQAGGVKGTFVPRVSAPIIEQGSLDAGNIKFQKDTDLMVDPVQDILQQPVPSKDLIQFKTKVCFNIHEALQARSLTEKNKIQDQFSEVYLTQPSRIISQTLGLDEIEVKMSIKELKSNDFQNPHKLRFDSQMEILNKGDLKKLQDKNLHLFIYERVPMPMTSSSSSDKTKKVGDGQQLLKPVLDCQDLALFDEKQGIHSFPTLQLLSSFLEQNSGRSLLDRSLIIEVHETFFENLKKKKGEEQQTVQKERFIARCEMDVIDAIKYAKSGVYMRYLVDEKKRVKGKLYIQNFSIKSHYSFMDLYIKNSINIVPIIGVDFSLANLSLDGTQGCIHTLKQGAPNDYIDCLQSVSKSFHFFSRFMMAYGFGARHFQSGKGDACNLFAMNSNFMSPFVDSPQDLVQGYESTLKNVQLSLPVMYRSIIKQVCDLAEGELGVGESDINQVQNYYVLTLLMAGMVDDFQDTLNEMLRAANLPISIMVIKIGRNQDENDSQKFINKCMTAFQTSERVFIDLFDFENYKNEQGVHSVFCAQQLEYDLIKSIPGQVEKFFELNKFELESEQFTNNKLEQALKESLIMQVDEQKEKLQASQRRGSLHPGEILLPKFDDSIQLKDVKNWDEDSMAGSERDAAQSESEGEELSAAKIQEEPSQAEKLGEAMQFVNEEQKQQEAQGSTSANTSGSGSDKGSSNGDKSYQDNGKDYKVSIQKHITSQKQDLILKCIERGVQEKHILEFVETQLIPDFELDNVLHRLQQSNILTVENGYEQPEFILHPADEQKKRRQTMAELDQMKDE